MKKSQLIFGGKRKNGQKWGLAITSGAVKQGEKIHKKGEVMSITVRVAREKKRLERCIVRLTMVRGTGKLQRPSNTYSKRNTVIPLCDKVEVAETKGRLKEGQSLGYPMQMGALHRIPVMRQVTLQA